MNEAIRIDPCPVCEKAHRYLLDVERDTTVGLVTARPEPQVAVGFTRLFTCPDKGQVFQARITLYQTARSRIRSVLVVSVLEVDEDG
jgi:hypothetical protein